MLEGGSDIRSKFAGDEFGSAVAPAKPSVFIAFLFEKMCGCSVNEGMLEGIRN